MMLAFRAPRRLAVCPRSTHARTSLSATAADSERRLARSPSPMRVDRHSPLGDDCVHSHIPGLGMTAGKRIGPYRIFEPLGRGGMGVVYRARHVGSEHAVALKTVHSAMHWSLDALRREILALTTIRHPGIVRIVDHGTHDGLPWYAMDLLEGESLRSFGQRIWSRYRRQALPMQEQQVSDTLALSEPARRRSSVLAEETMRSAEDAVAREAPSAPQPAEADGAIGARPPLLAEPPAAAGQLASVLALMRQVCATLAFLHGEGFINCDLKPENILLADGIPVIVDFGLTAHHPGGCGREALEAQRAMAGTLQYMSPERIRGEFVDARSDLYSIGCILYELVVGRPVFSGNAAGLIARHLQGQPVLPSQLVQGVPPELDSAILKLLAKDLLSRFGYADEVAAGLAEINADGKRLPEFHTPRPYLYRPGFSGRNAILAELTELRESAILGSGAFVLLGGESGIGKTRLAMELTRVMPTSRMSVITSEVPPPAIAGASATVAPLHALRPLLLAAADFCQQGGPDSTNRVLGEGRSVLALYEPSVAHVPSDDGDSRITPLPANVSRQQLFRHLSDTLMALAREQPLLLVLDDLGWADELSSSFLASLTAEQLEAAPLLIVGTFRSDEPSPAISMLRALPHVKTIDLPRLDDAAVRSMAAEMLALRDPPESFMAFLARQTEGNPFFVTEYLRGAVSERILFRDKNAWHLPIPTEGGSPKFDSLRMPRALRELIERRLSRLTPAGTQAATAIAVLGRETDFETAREVAALPEHSYLGALDELLRRHVLDDRAESGRLQFAHAKLREVAYAQAAPERLTEFHARAAETLQREWKTRADASQIWATLGHHFAAAHRAESAAYYLRLAADHARATHANIDARSLYREAIDQTQSLLLRLSTDSTPFHQTLLELYESMGDVLNLTAQRDEARINYAQALGRAAPGDRIRRARLQRKTGKTWEIQHQHDEALRQYALAESELDMQNSVTSSEYRDEWLQIHLDRLWVYYWLDCVPAMDALIETLSPIIQDAASPVQRARYFDACAKRNLRRDRYIIHEETLRFARSELSASEESGDFMQLLQARFGLGFVLIFHGNPIKGSALLQHALMMAERAGALAQQARCLTYLAVAARMRGLADETRSLTIRSGSISKAAGMLDYVAAAHANQSWIALRNSDMCAALKQCEEAVAIWGNDLSLVFPFQWMALLPGIAAALTLSHIDKAASFAAALLDESQQPLPGAATDAFARATKYWASGDRVATRHSLQIALQHLSSTENP